MQTDSVQASSSDAEQAVQANQSDLSNMTNAARYRVIRRNGKQTNFDQNKISIAITKAFLAVEGGKAAASNRVHDRVKLITSKVVESLFRRMPDNGTVHIEDIQDQVELALMRHGEHKVARAYVLYREQHALERASQTKAKAAQEPVGTINIKHSDGNLRTLLRVL